MQRAGDRVRINMQLINAATDEHLWAETYDRELTIENLFAIQSEVAAEVARALDAVLSEEDKQRLESMPTSNIGAYNEYVLGRQELAKRTAEALGQALAHFEKAIELDPDYALAYVGLADTHALQVEYAGVRTKDTFAPRREAVEKALDLDPLSGETFTALGLLKYQEGDTAAAEESFLKAIDLSPNYATAYHWYSNVLNGDEERREESLLMIRKALSLDPAAPVLSVNLANRLRLLGRIEEARAVLLDGAVRNPAFPGFYGRMANLLLSQGRLGEAAAWQDEAVGLNPSAFGNRYFQCFLQVELDDIASAQACLEILRRDFADFPESSFADLVTNIYFVSNQPQMAVDYLESVNKEEPGQGMKMSLARAYVWNAEWPKARQTFEEITPLFYSEEEVTIGPHEIGPAVNAATTMRDGDGWSSRAHYLMGQALETMRSMHRTRGIGYGSLDVAAYGIRGEAANMMSALRDAIDSGWRVYWWVLRMPTYQATWSVQDRRSEWDALIAELEADIAAQRQWYQDHKDDPLF